MKLSTFDILRKRYPESQYALMAEVSDAAGFNRSRSADYIAVGLWPSRGLFIEGIELKSFRNDWLSELKNPKKAENIFKYCDFFWLLTSDETIAKTEEIPVNWGWLCIKGQRIIMKKQAPKLNSEPVSKNFLAAMLKRACNKENFVHINSIEERITRAYDLAKTENKRSIERCESLMEEMRDRINIFESTSGIKIGPNRDPKKIGEAVKFISEGGAESIKKDLNRLKQSTEYILSHITKSLENL